MKNIFKTLWLALAATTFVACNGPSPDPEPPTPDPVVTDNSAVYDGKKVEFKAVTLDASLTGFYTVVANINEKDTPAQAISITIPADKVGTAIDVKSTVDYKFLNGSTICTEIKELTGKSNATVTAGTITFNTPDGSNKLNVEFTLTLVSNGKKFVGKLSTDLPLKPIAENTILFGDEAPVEFKSIVFDDMKDENKVRLYIIASATEGITTYDDMMRKDDKGNFVNKPLITSIGYAHMNKTINVMTEEEAIFSAINSTGVGAEVESFMLGMYPTISAGTFTTTYNKETGKISLFFDVTAKASGKLLRANITGTYTPTPPPDENYMSFNGTEAKTIQTRFYQKENGGVTFYVCPTTVTAAEFMKEGHYAKIWISDENMEMGEIIIEESDGYDITYRNYRHYDESIIITPTDTKDATGIITVMEIAAGEYLLEYDITFKDENKIFCTTDGKFPPFS